ncbi:MAG: hypothetical protein ATN36_04665 [Epulopiscium sp. Nele67-Bin005]|nr:MAG: hypothetical protein ATN36_04665 [Epulopiscium sp. Nele67-Bin005]
MIFERARTQSQKDIRIKEVLDVTTKLYHEIGYENITLSKISEDLSFTRVNLYKYFKSKEEIFLKISDNELIKFTNILIDNLQGINDLDQFANIFAKTLDEQKLFLHLLTLDLAVIQYNISEEKLIEHWDTVASQIDLIHHQITKNFPHLSLTDATTLLSHIIIFSRGLYSHSYKNDLQIKICEQVGIYTPEYTNDMTNFIKLNVKSF